MDLGDSSETVVKKVHGVDYHVKPKDVMEALKNSLIVVLVYFLIAAVIFSIGRFVWWVGFAFFAIFAAYALFELVAVGFFLILLGLIVRIAVRFVRARGLTPARFDSVLEGGEGLFWTALLMGSVELCLVLITIVLGLSFFW